MPRWLIRAGDDSDGPALIALIWACWSAYPGIRMDVDREMPELHALASYYAAQEGALWIAERGGRIGGMIAVRRHDRSVAEICRVYVDPSLHGSGLGHELLDRAETFAITSGAVRLALWSDTRFDRAHRFYEKRSYVRHGAIRVLEDLSQSLEFGYAKPVDGIQPLDIAAVRSAAQRLADVMLSCVDDSGSMCLVAPVVPDKTVAFWHRIAADVGTRERIVVAAWRGGIMVGAGMLHLAQPDNQAHRAEVQTVLVAPNYRRTGLGRAIMRVLEQAALDNGRTLLTLNTTFDGAGHALCRAENWQEAGWIPDFTRGPDGISRTMAIFWKRIA